MSRGYTKAISKGWWQGEYVIGVTSWLASVPGRGSFSNLSSSDFASRYRDRYDAEASYQSAAHFAAGCILVAAVEAAGSLQTDAVVKSLSKTSMKEFFGHIEFDANGISKASMLSVQFPPASLRTVPGIIAPPRSANAKIVYPIPSWAQRRCEAIGPEKSINDDTWRTSGSLICSGHGNCNRQGKCECEDGYTGADCAQEDYTLLIVGLCISFFVLCMCGCAGFHWYRVAKIKRSREKQAIIGGLQATLDALKDSLVNMRVIVQDFTPSQGTNASSCPRSGSQSHVGIDMAQVVVDNNLIPAPPAPPQACWYWQEDASRLDSHPVVLPPDWIPYDHKVSQEIETKYQLYLQGKLANNQCRVDIGGSSKKHASDSGGAFIINFTKGVQINAHTDYERNIQRIEQQPPDDGTGASSDSWLPSLFGSGSGAAAYPGGDDTFYAAAGGDGVLLEIHVGALIQISREHVDFGDDVGLWSYGTVVDAGDNATPLSCDDDSISTTAGWFPSSCADQPADEDLKRLQSRMGAGADCLAPPVEWDAVKDLSQVEKFELKDGPEKQAVVDSFMATQHAPGLNNKRNNFTVSVVGVERVQNISMWQSYAVKRQTIIAREQSASNDQLSLDAVQKRHERKWLWHGTNAEVIPKIIQQGFNRSFCGRNATFYGKGVYFAKNSSYSSSPTYSTPDDAGVQHMFACRVVVGEYCRGVKDALTPDIRPDIPSGTVLYDTTVDVLGDPQIFVTYHDAQAYPEYIIHFIQN